MRSAFATPNALGTKQVTLHAFFVALNKIKFDLMCSSVRQVIYEEKKRQRAAKDRRQYNAWGPIHTYPYSFEKATFFSRPHVTFSHRPDCACLTHAHLLLYWQCEVSVFEKFRLRPSTRKRENSVFKKFHSVERFPKVPFSVIVFVGYVWTEAVSIKKKLRFQIKTDNCGRGLCRNPLRAETNRTPDRRLQFLMSWKNVITFSVKIVRFA